MTTRHDVPRYAGDTGSVEDTERPLLERQLADLAALKMTSERRQSLITGSPEWREALRDEDGLIARVLEWAGRRSGHLRAE
jgi:hypothetical protein